ncbi:hypothetical protein FQA47_022865 [Oryzias melastigma]|uniref:Uncharacterized protein n=1 Tax=Oryzias melastigma TaxID=30732 RepID=A0A834C4Q4_ORYME|nr:hypothetical protein FQA47_022865 [Oryzias melastigma]
MSIIDAGRQNTHSNELDNAKAFLYLLASTPLLRVHIGSAGWCNPLVSSFCGGNEGIGRHADADISGFGARQQFKGSLEQQLFTGIRPSGGW